MPFVGTFAVALGKRRRGGGENVPIDRTKKLTVHSPHFGPREVEPIQTVDLHREIKTNAKARNLFRRSQKTEKIMGKWGREGREGKQQPQADGAGIGHDLGREGAEGGRVYDQ